MMFVLLSAVLLGVCSKADIQSNDCRPLDELKPMPSAQAVE